MLLKSLLSSNSWEEQEGSQSSAPVDPVVRWGSHIKQIIVIVCNRF